MLKFIWNNFDIFKFFNTFAIVIELFHSKKTYDILLTYKNHYYEKIICCYCMLCIVR